MAAESHRNMEGKIIPLHTSIKRGALENEKKIESKKETPMAATLKAEPKKEALKETKLKKELQKEKK